MDCISTGTWQASPCSAVMTETGALNPDVLYCTKSPTSIVTICAMRLAATTTYCYHQVICALVHNMCRVTYNGMTHCTHQT